MEGDEPRRCIYVVPRKNRRCKMLVKKGNDFCGEHLVFAQDNDTRLPCPNDPKHSVIKKDLEKHLKRCNSRIVHELPWIVENCNAVVKETKSTEKIDRRPSQEEIDAAIEKIEKCWEKTRDDIRVEVGDTLLFVMSLARGKQLRGQNKAKMTVGLPLRPF